MPSQMLDVLLQIFVVFPNVEPLRQKVRQIFLLFSPLNFIIIKCGVLQITSFLHRMIEVLGPSVFPYFPMALERLLSDSEVCL